MTGKELALVFLGMGGAAAAAGVGVAVAVNDGPAPVDRTAEILERFDAVDSAIEKSNETARRNRRNLDNLAERLGELEIRAAKAQAAPAVSSLPRASSSGSRSVRMPARIHTETDADMDATESEAVVHDFTSAEDMTAIQKKIQDALAKATENMGGDMPLDITSIGNALGSSEMFAGMRKGMELRKLPEEERWTKAQEELGLGYNQVEELKQAVADRDAAMKEAMVVKRSETTDGGGSFTFSTLDREKAQDAQRTYDDRVGSTLNADQKESWNKNGYNNAFGRGGMGSAGAHVISIGQAISAPVTVEREEEK